MRPISQPHHNQLFLQIKFSINHLVISYLCGFATIPLPLLSFFWVFFISTMLIH
jgi:hypothetical protein